MNLELTHEQKMVQATAAEFTDSEILPKIAELDREHRLDMTIIRGMSELGLLGAAIPEQYGGQGLDFIATGLICEEIERGDGAFRTLLSVHLGLNSLTLLEFGSEEQKQAYLIPQARGQKIACFGLTEPGVGSDVAALESRARREGDHYVLNGQKTWISYANVADHFLVFAKTDQEAGHKGISAFLLDRTMPGIETRDIPHKLGVWAGSTGEIFLSDVEVPETNRLGREGEGFKIAMYALDMGRFTVAAGAVGTMRAALEASVRYANERHAFGRPIGNHQLVQDMIAEMVRGLETSRLLVYQAAWLKDLGVRNTRETSLAKWHATECAFQAANSAVQIHGAYGYSGEYPVERIFRNARAPVLYEGTSEIHKMLQAEDALGYRKLNG
ncbi:MAG: butyryl-CoA dehydrogenase [Actinobacteria bacterium RBG_19FT_COMBO_54_7]|uniref:Butyryl-CoA dehydrogenase n=1 Tax=Candidatus Solincola sediminis TaxID=1797199 RepID=A0A1F2WM74_9ACTN|nr:MAG: butyryl-CoA dehydrogenase [Candidatus Solincola sediminis]OFW58384.1 MAG: butyryl-CoA dehydrogenase [Candidatus Solincola sediminis]OFW65996.1 MAG: butyryl-CoA dehydrogenase [Actinobacteria bacterium RBG_19FT_COMBO_54_7]